LFHVDAGWNAEQAVLINYPSDAEKKDLEKNNIKLKDD
jgi:hypothetical protein